MQPSTTPTIFLFTDDTNADNVHGREPTHVVGKPDLRIFKLPFISFALQLLVHFIHHPQAAGADGMPEAFEATVDLYRLCAIELNLPASISSFTFPLGLNCRSSIAVASVIEKQSWTSAMLISSRGFLMPASL